MSAEEDEVEDEEEKDNRCWQLKKETDHLVPKRTVSYAQEVAGKRGLNIATLLSSNMRNSLKNHSIQTRKRGDQLIGEPGWPHVSVGLIVANEINPGKSGKDKKTKDWRRKITRVAICRQEPLDPAADTVFDKMLGAIRNDETYETAITASSDDWTNFLFDDNDKEAVASLTPGEKAARACRRYRHHTVERQNAKIVLEDGTLHEGIAYFGDQLKSVSEAIKDLKETGRELLQYEGRTSKNVENVRLLLDEKEEEKEAIKSELRNLHRYYNLICLKQGDDEQLLKEEDADNKEGKDADDKEGQEDDE